jgi:glyoxylate/hydroxypyruvate reductase A
VLGVGQIGGHVARAFAALGFRALGWSRTPKAIEGVDCRHGPAALAPLLGACDYVISVLPSTAATRELFDAGNLAAMKPGAWLVNVGRGDSIVEADLLAGLDSGPLAGAVLDVFREEPLPAAHPFWGNPKITITPHVSGWHLTGGLEDVAENYRRLQGGRPLLHEIDRDAGY